MTDQPTPLEFLQLLYKGAVTTGTVEFRLLPSRKQLWMPWPCFPEHPDEIKSFPAKQDVYFGVSLRRDNTDGGGKNLVATHLVWIDIDLKGTEWTHGQTDVLNMTPEELHNCAWAAFQHYLASWLAAGLPPRAVVYTGHGLQVYWARRGRSDIADTEAYNRGLAVAFDGDPKTIDAPRIFRMPGSQNLKNKERPLPVELWHQEAEAWVEHDALEPYRMAEKVRPVKEAAAPSLAGPVAAPREGESVIAQYNARWPITAVLERYGYRREDDHTYTRPGEDASGRDVKLLENKRGVLCSYHHSSNDPLAGAPDAEHLMEPFDVYRLNEHGGDFKAAVRAASAELGLGDQAAAGTIGKTGGQAAKPTRTADLPEKPTLAQYRDLMLDWCAEHGHIYRYHQTRRSWWRYSSGVYLEVIDEVIYQRTDKTLQDFGYTNLKTALLREVLDKISREESVASLEVDQTAWELNTRSGILDLSSGQLREHTPEYFSTIQSAAHYRPGAVAHDWLAFLAEAVPDRADRLLLQQFAGLCLTGDTSPQRALLLVGDGGTGKSTFVRVLQAVLGNLATSSALESIKDDSFLIGRLVGKRMCVVSELQRNVDWLPFKRITGEDMIGVDVKNKTPYTVKLDIKLIILSNVVPFLGDDTTNTSLMRRFLPVAFNVKPAEPDPTLESRLTDPEELPGVLNWMLEGLASLRAAGMRFPASDTASLGREIVEESNRVIGFLREACAYVTGASTGTGELYSEYRQWCGQTGHKPVSSTTFAKQLGGAAKHFGKEIGRERTKTSRFYTNVLLSNAPSGWEDEDER